MCKGVYQTYLHLNVLIHYLIENWLFKGIPNKSYQNHNLGLLELIYFLLWRKTEVILLQKLFKPVYPTTSLKLSTAVGTERWTSTNSLDEMQFLLPVVKIHDLMKATHDWVKKGPFLHCCVVWIPSLQYKMPFNT